MGAIYSSPCRCLNAAPSTVVSEEAEGVLRTPKRDTSASHKLTVALARRAAAQQDDTHLCLAISELPAGVAESFARAATENENGVSLNHITLNERCNFDATKHRTSKTSPKRTFPLSCGCRDAGDCDDSWRSRSHSSNEVRTDVRKWRSYGISSVGNKKHRAGVKEMTELRIPRTCYGKDSLKTGECVLDGLTATLTKVSATTSVATSKTTSNRGTYQTAQPMRTVLRSTAFAVRRLNLAGCELATDEALSTILRATQLTHLSLDRCITLTDKAMEVVAGQQLLRELSLAACRQIGNAGISCLRDLRTLRVVSLERCGRLTDDALRNTLRCWPHLEVLNLAFCYKLTDRSLCNVPHLRRLSYLDVRSTRVTSALWAALRPLQNMRAVLAAHTSVTDEAVCNLDRSIELRVFDVEGTGVGDALLAVLSKLPNLETLNLGYTAVTDGGVAKYVTKLAPSLNWLSLDETDIGDYAIERLGCLLNLAALNLADTSVTTFGITAITRLSALRALSLAFTAISDAALCSVARLHSLESLVLDGENITDVGISHLTALVNLRELEIYGAAVSDDGMRHVACLANLRVLEMCLALVGDQGAICVAQALNELRHLNLSQNRLGSHGVCAILRACRNLHTLNIAYNQEVDCAIVGEVCAHPSLAAICVQGTHVAVQAPDRIRDAGIVVTCDKRAHSVG